MALLENVGVLGLWQTEGLRFHDAFALGQAQDAAIHLLHVRKVNRYTSVLKNEYGSQAKEEELSRSRYLLHPNVIVLHLVETEDVPDVILRLLYLLRVREQRTRLLLLVQGRVRTHIFS